MAFLKSPLVLSVSRATDVPAFHARWFMRRLEAGYCLRRNPFRPDETTRVSFERVRAIVFWSKNPAAMIPYLSEIKARGLEFYFQYTLNDYEKAGLEPGLPSLGERLDTFRELSEMIGKSRVVWRFDPIVLGNGLTVGSILNSIGFLMRELTGYTEKLVFSFVDVYPKLADVFRNSGLRAPTKAEMLELGQGIAEIAREHTLRVATCAEKLDIPGVEHNRCVDSDLLWRLCPDCTEFAPRLKQNLLPGMKSVIETPKKDAGQREACGCFPSQDIGSYGTCGHFCTYCYANPRREIVRARMAALDEKREFL